MLFSVFLLLSLDLSIVFNHLLLHCSLPFLNIYVFLVVFRAVWSTERCCFFWFLSCFSRINTGFNTHLMGLSALYLSPDAVESRHHVVTSHLGSHPNNLRTPPVLHSMSDVHRTKICSADESDPIERAAIPQTAYPWAIIWILKGNMLKCPLNQNK